jgi:hypothetical protein
VDCHFIVDGRVGRENRGSSPNRVSLVSCNLDAAIIIFDMTYIGGVGVEMAATGENETRQSFEVFCRMQTALVAEP